MKTTTAIPILVGVGISWGSSFLLIKVVVKEISPLELAAGRMFLGMLVLMGVVSVRRTSFPPINPAFLGHLLVLTTLYTILPVTLIALGQQYIESGTAAVLNATTPIFTAVLAAVLLTDEELTRGRVMGVLFGFLGVVVLTGGQTIALTQASLLGALAVIGASFAFGFGSVHARKLLRNADPLGIAALMLMGASILTAPVVLLIYGTSGYASLSAKAMAAIVILGVVITGLTQVAFLWLVDVIGSVRAQLASYLIPVVGLFLGWLVLDEHVGLNAILGCFLIVVGVASVMWRGPGFAPSRTDAAKRTA